MSDFLWYLRHRFCDGCSGGVDDDEVIRCVYKTSRCCSRLYRDPPSVFYIPDIDLVAATFAKHHGFFPARRRNFFSVGKACGEGLDPEVDVSILEIRLAFSGPVHVLLPWVGRDDEVRPLTVFEA